MKRVLSVLEGIGFILMMIGMGSMDSASVVIPMVLTFGGIGMMCAGSRLEDQICG